jgi:DNA-binding transcriptional LysR family regulator
MELATLRAFVKVVQTGSFTRAAEALDTQKAYLSRVVSQLERELGARLLERTMRSLSLTEIGREFFERAVGILASVEDAERAVQKAQGEPRGVLTDWSLPTVPVHTVFASARYLTPKVRAFIDLAVERMHTDFTPT